MSGSTAQNSQTVNATTGQMPTPMASPAPQPQISTDQSKNIPNINPQEAGQVPPATLNAVSPTTPPPQTSNSPVQVTSPQTTEEKKDVEPGSENQPPAKKIQTIEKPKDGSELNIVELINYIVKQAIKAKTSDIHIEPHEEVVVVRFRIDGILKDVLQVGKDIQESLLFRIKVAAKMRTDEHFAPQDGRIRFIIENKKIDTRISILPTSSGEKVVMRLLIKEGKSFTFSALGMSDADQLVVEKSYKRPYGMILAVGPTGSGKTTSLYAILQKLNSRDVNITTVEDPVEYSIDGVNHIQVNNKANLTFASGLRSILRQDPDIVMIGEIRDAETANIATNAALTGHLVLSSLHTNDSISTIPRLIDMDVEPFLVASTLNIVIAQRLARKLCDKCKVQYSIDQEELNRINKIRQDIGMHFKVGDAVYKEKGCETCGDSGFQGRFGLFEILEITEKIRRMISERENIDDVFKVARENGMKLIVEDGVNAIKTGITSLEEIMRVTALKQ
jgi:type IV pilus assembly protein PilB